ncbi:peptidoglycan-binding domain-containing protein [Streptomyces sp. NPDC002688]|uniref:peptidoglycan-binding domain-containing protein n=1 Tax=Streptomyces sp. NPDC002688 TaxID=3154423 RepID=UPI0033292344
MTTLDEISQRLAAGENLADVTLSLLAEPLRRSLLRCALVNSFDDVLYAEALRDPDGPPLADLLRQPCVDAQSGSANIYRVTPDMQEAAWRAWWRDEGMEPDSTPVPPKLRAAELRISEFCEHTGRITAALRALAVADPDKAADRFEQWYRERDENLDFPSCQNLLDALSEPIRVKVSSPRLAAVRSDLDRYLRSRMLWYEALLRSGTYLSRPALEQRLNQLLSGTPTRALRLHADGGMGKSLMLRWFIARRCVAAPARVPCALVDLDAVDAVNIARYPWLLMLELAKQLNEQMVGAPFQKLLRKYGAYRSVLLREAPVECHSGAAALDTAAVEFAAEDIRERFLVALSEDRSATPLLIVLDAFEVAVLRPMGGAAKLVEVLADIHEAADQVRLVVSGRLTGAEAELTRLGERLPPDVMSQLGVPKFTPEESRNYLFDRRGIRRAEMVEAIVRAADGTPWQLALHADIADYSPDMSADSVEGLDPRLAWCIDRIIGQIDNDGLQWLVRYGVLARRLSRDFAEQVVLPRMVSAMRGCDDDQPEGDLRLPGSTPVFRTGVQPPQGPEEFARLWENLKRYSAEVSSWVSVAPTDPDTLVFHPSVAEPLRRLLSRQPVYRLLHEDAARYYDRLVELHPQAWAAWTRAALYHRFQAHGYHAAPAWRNAVGLARTSGSLEDVAEIAGEILGPDYLDEEDEPRKDAAGIPMLDPQLHAEAQVELAWALVRRARCEELPGGHQLWSEAERRLGNAEAILIQTDVRLPYFRWNAARAALLLSRGRPGRAEEVLRPTVSTVEASTDYCFALEVYAETLRALGRSDRVTEVLERAWAIARTMGDQSNSEYFARILAHDRAEHLRYDDALRWVRTAPRDDTGVASYPGMHFTEAELALNLGLPATAASLTDVQPDDPRARPLALGVKALLMLGRPREARARCEKALSERVGLLPEREAAVFTLRGQANIALMQVEQAMRDLLTAREHYARLQDYERAADCALNAATAQLYVVGNLWEAEQYLDEARRLTFEDGGEIGTRCQLLRSALMVRHGAPERGARLCAGTLARLEQSGAPPQLLAEVAAHCLAVAGDRYERFGEVLLAVLRQVTPATARLAMLGPLESCPGPVSVGAELLSLVLPDGAVPETEDPADTAWLESRAATVYRLAGRLGQARRHATRAAQFLAEEDSFACWRLVGFMEQTGPVEREEWQPPALVGYDEYPMLQAAHLVTVSQRWAGFDPVSHTIEQLRRADSLLSQESANQWQAMAHEALSRLLARTGNPEATHHHHTARAVLAELGDDREVPAPRMPAKDTVNLDLAPDGALLVHDGTRTLGRMEPTAPLAWALRKEGHRTTLGRLVDAVLEGAPLLPGVGTMEPLLRQGLDQPLDICLTISWSQLAQVPWETAVTACGPLATDDRVRFIYRMPRTRRAEKIRTSVLQASLDRLEATPGPVDGLMGSQTRRAISDVQRAFGLDADGIAGSHTWDGLRKELSQRRQNPRVLILRRGSASQLASERGQHLGGSDLAVAYASAGWTVDVVDDPNSEILERLARLSIAPADVIHVSTTLDVVGSVPHLDFGSSAYGDASTWMTKASESVAVTDLDRFVARIAAGRAAPLVIIDVASPAGPSELVRQLLLRNDFAFQLATLGNAVVVLATGLTEPGDSRQIDEIVHGLRNGSTPADVARGLQRLATSEDRLQTLPYTGTALMSSLAPHEMLPVGV